MRWKEKVSIGQYYMPDVWFFDVGFYSIYISSLGWMCDSALFCFSSALLSLFVYVCVSTGRCKTNFSNQLIFICSIHSEKCSLLVSMLRTHSIGPEIDLCLFSNMEHGSIVFRLFLYAYLFQACYLSLAYNTQISSEMGTENELLNKSMNYHFMKLKLTSTI